jgi:hypothetical protein
MRQRTSDRPACGQSEGPIEGGCGGVDCSADTALPHSSGVLKMVGSGCEIVAMVQTAKSWHGDYPAICLCIISCDPTCRSLLLQSKMSPVFVIITDVLSHEALEMLLVEHDHMIQQVSSEVPGGCPIHAVSSHEWDRATSTPEPNHLVTGPVLLQKPALSCHRTPREETNSPTNEPSWIHLFSHCTNPAPLPSPSGPRFPRFARRPSTRVILSQRRTPRICLLRHPQFMSRAKTTQPPQTKPNKPGITVMVNPVK